jgi:DNA-binding NarL/FixJ family response regulator
VVVADSLPAGGVRVLVADDEDFVRMTIAEVLRSAGVVVATASSVADALEQLPKADPHVVVSDLDFGPGPTGADLLAHVHVQSPWIGLVALTSHASPALALRPGESLPPNCLYLVKSQLHSLDDVVTAVHDAIRRTQVSPRKREMVAKVTPVQAEVLQLMAEGLTNKGVAERRGTSLRAAEALVHRTIQALGIEPSTDFDSRLVAILMWQRGEVDVG